MADGWSDVKKTPQDIVDDVYRGAATCGINREGARRIMADTPSAGMGPTPETQDECRRIYGKGWD